MTELPRIQCNSLHFQSTSIELNSIEFMSFDRNAPGFEECRSVPHLPASVEQRRVGSLQLCRSLCRSAAHERLESNRARSVFGALCT